MELSIPSCIGLCRTAALAVLLAVLSACSGGDDGDAAPAEGAGRPAGVALVDGTGGTVIGEDGARLVVPAAAMEEAAELSMAQNADGAPPLPVVVAPAGSVFALRPHGTRFAVPVQLRLPMAGLPVPAGSRVALLKAELGGAWELIEDAQVQGSELVAEVREFSFVLPVFLPVDRGLTAIDAPLPEFTLVPLSPGVDNRALLGEVGRVYRQGTAARLPFRIDANVPSGSAFASLCGGAATLNVYTGPATRYRLAGDAADAERLGGYRAVREPVASMTLVPGTVQSLNFTVSVVDQLFNDDRHPLPPGVLPITPDAVNPADLMGVSVEVDCAGIILTNVVPRFAVAAGFPATPPRALLQGPRDVVAVVGEPARYQFVTLGAAAPSREWYRTLASGVVEVISSGSATVRLPNHSLLQRVKGRIYAYTLSSDVTLPEHEGSEMRVFAFGTGGVEFSAPPPARLSLPGGVPLPRFTVEPADGERAPGGSFTLDAVVQSVPVPRFAQWQTRANPDAPWLSIGTGSVVAGFRTVVDPSAPSIWSAPNVFRTSPVTGRTSLTSGSGRTLTMEDNGRQFRVGVTNSAGTTYSRVATLRVTTGLVAPAFSVQPADAVVAAGLPVRFAFSGTGTEPVSIQWYANGRAVPGGNYTALDIAAVNAGNAGEYQVELRNAEGRVLSRVARLTVAGAGTPTPPVITTQPASITVPEGASAAFAVAVSGSTTPTYQWQRNGVDLPGRTSATLEIAAVAASDAGSYGVVITAGGASVRSAVASLNLGAASTAPTISTPPTGLVVNIGQTATLAVAASGSAPLRYQWQRDGSDLAGATGPVLVIENAQPGDAGLYTVTVRNGRGDVTSPAAELVVSPAPGAPAITTQPMPQDAVVGDGVRFSAAVSGNPAPQCLWTRNGIVIADATDCTSVSLPAVTRADDGVVINLFAYSSGGFAVGGGARLTVREVEAPSFTVQPVGVGIVSGGAAEFTVAVNGHPAPTVEWSVNGSRVEAGTRVETGACRFDVVTAALTLRLQDVALGCDGSTLVALARNRAGAVTSDTAVLAVRPATASATLLAGLPGTPGSVDGALAEARFNTPNYLTVARDGGLAIGDFGNSTIRVLASGTVKTLAGTAGVFGHADGTGTSAVFAGNGGLAYDSQGNLFVSDWDNHVIRRITPEGVVSTFAGSPGLAGSADGPGAEARFRNPNGLVIDAADNVVVVDWGNHTLRRITPAGLVSTLAGTAGVPGAVDGAGPAARFRTPGAVAIDGSGVLYVSDMDNHAIRRITPEGMVTTLAGRLGEPGHVDGGGAEARLDTPAWIAATTDGTLFVVSAAGDTVRRVTPDGAVGTVVGVRGESTAVVTGPDPRLRHARGVWALGPRELILAADQALLRIVLP